MNLGEIRVLLDRARHTGMDPIMLLDRRGLLLTDKKRNEIVREVAENLAEIVELSSPQQMGFRDPRTPADMKRGIAEFMRNFVKERKRDHGSEQGKGKTRS